MDKFFTIIKVVFGSIFKKPFMTNPDLAKAEVDKQIEKAGNISKAFILNRQEPIKILLNIKRQLKLKSVN